MRRCLQLAALGNGHVAPNPMVGAVLVHENRIIGEGYHRQFGGGHAEVECLGNVADSDRHLISQSILYVSLEPCNHHGKTPPCTDLIIKCSIPRIVIGCRDINEKVNGAGISRLANAGIEVTEGVCETEASFLNRRFFTFHRRQRPYVILKWARSSDGFIGKPDGRVAISNEITNRLVHKWRSEEAAIMVGTETALVDNPSLTVRRWPGRNPIRVVADMGGRLPKELSIFSNEAKTIVINQSGDKEAENVSFRKVISRGDMLKLAMDVLFRENIQSLIVEGGARLLQSFIDSGLWDEARVITAKSLVLTSGVREPVLPLMHEVSKEELGDDVVLFFENL